VKARVAKALVKAIVNRLDTTTTIVATIINKIEEKDIKTKIKDIKDIRAKDTKVN